MVGSTLTDNLRKKKSNVKGTSPQGGGLNWTK